jgi:hypothetical protein
MKNINSLIVSVLFITIIAGLIVFIKSSDAQTTKDPAQKSKIDQDQDEINKIKTTFPITDYSQNDFQTPEEKTKGRKYDVIPVLDPSIAGNTREGIINHWAEGLSALPVDKSRIIVFGTVTEAKAHLSEKKQAVYSEFTIEVEKVFKNDTDKKINSKISAERQGGIVRFPSGFEKWVYVEGQGMPVIQKRYLFFLSYDAAGVLPQKEDLSILTAYEIKDGRVTPLDNPGGGTHPIATTYTGKDETVLFNDLEKSLK